MERFLFALLAGLLIWAPLPLGSNRFWSLSLLDLLCALVFAGALRSLVDPYSASSTAKLLRKNQVILALFWLIPLWTALQLAPLPPDLLAMISDNGTLTLHISGWRSISLDHTETLMQFQRSVGLAMFFTSALILVNTPERVERIAEVTVLSGVIQASYGVLVSLGGHGFDILNIGFFKGDSRTATGTFINRNHFAGFLEMCIALGVGLLVTHIVQKKDPYLGWRAALRRFLESMMAGKARIRIYLGLMVVALVLTHSRMGNTAFFVSLGASALIGLLLFHKGRKSGSLVTLFTSLIIIDMLIVGAWFGLDELAERLESTSIQHEERTFVFAKSLDLLHEYPVAGIGAGVYKSVFNAYKDNHIYYYFHQTHNDYLQIAIEYGVIGLILFGLIAVHSLWMAFKAQRSRHTAILKGCAFGAMMGIISLLIHSWVDFNLQIPANALLFTLLCAIACICYTMEHQSHNQHRSGSS